VPAILFESPAAEGRVLVGPVEHDNPETREYPGNSAEVVRIALADLFKAQWVVGILGMGLPGPIGRLAELALREASVVVNIWSPSTSGYSRHTVSLAPADTSKGHALLWLAGFLGVSREQVLAVGDNVNDVSLLEVAGLGVAMGNAIPSVLAIAREVVADNANDGVSEALERWVLTD